MKKNAAAVALGRLGGSVKSERKAAAVRENGKRGGRPPMLCRCGHIRSRHPNGGPCLAYAAGPRECGCMEFSQ